MRALVYLRFHGVLTQVFKTLKVLQKERYGKEYVFAIIKKLLVGEVAIIISQKKTKFIFLFVGASIFVKAQDEYKNVMPQNINAVDTTKNAQTLNAAASTFAAGYDYKKDWRLLY